MAWTAAADTTGALSRRELAPDDQACIDDVLTAAAEWQAGRLPWQEAARIGAIELHGSPSARYTRFLAFTSTPKLDPRWHALKNLIDTLIRAEGFVLTAQGIYSPADRMAA